VKSKRVTFTDVLRIGEFRVLWVADAQSALGDQVGRVALSVLVFQRTNSAVLTALTYALTFLPALVGGALLSGLADRLPRRRLMVWCDVLRAALFAGMAAPHVPLWLICSMLVLAVLTEAPFTAAEAALIPAILSDEEYVVGTGLRTITYQIAQLAGFAGGGVAIALIGARQGLAVDAATFLVSAAMIQLWVRHRPAAQPSDGDRSDAGWSFLAGLKLIFGNPRLRTLVGLAWLAGVYVVPEGVAAPYAARISHGAAAVGLLMAAMPLGTAIGTYFFVRWVPNHSRSRWMGPLGMASGLPLLGCAMLPGLALSAALWACCGLFFCYQVQVVTEFVREVPDAQRGQAVGIASSGLLAVQGVGVLLGGWVAGTLGVGWAVGGAGAAGVLLALALTVMWSRASHGADGGSGGRRLVNSASGARHRA
jgi:MFS family permease